MGILSRKKKPKVRVPNRYRPTNPSRRDFLKKAGAGIGILAVTGVAVKIFGPKIMATYGKALDKQAIETYKAQFMAGTLPENVFVNSVQSRYFTTIMDTPQLTREISDKLGAELKRKPTKAELEKAVQGEARKKALEEFAALQK